MYNDAIEKEYLNHKTFIDICNSLTNLSKCTFTKVASVIVDQDGGIISTGVNGTIAGLQNCCDNHFEKRDDHIEYSEKYEVHAEMNAIIRLARSSIKPNRITLYTSLSPCKNCLKHILALQNNYVKVDAIVFGELYHRYTKEDIEQMRNYAYSAGIKLIDINEMSKLLNNK
tara:strand:+ start:15584 stop:16096 length:513 start_codon:yes stop_codon:yes gene_type:complete